MNLVTKRYLTALVLGIAAPVLVGLTAVQLIGVGESSQSGLVAGVMIVGTFAVTAALVAREKGRSLWYALAGWIAPLLPIILLLPHTKARRAELLGEAASTASPPPPSPAAAAANAIVLGEANQFLRYRAVSRAKVDAQAAVMDAVLTRPDAPPMKAVLLKSTNPADEFPWLIAKSGTHASVAAMRGYPGFKAAFSGLFGDQPLSIAWADHIAENCPAPGEAITALGRERYARIEQEIRDGKYAVERHLGMAKTPDPVTPTAASANETKPPAAGPSTACGRCGKDIGLDWHYDFESIDVAATVAAQCPQCGAITCRDDLKYGPDGNYPPCPACRVPVEALSAGAAYSSMVEDARSRGRYRGALKRPTALGRPVQQG